LVRRILYVETGLHKHDIGLLVEHKILVLLNAQVGLSVFGLFVRGISILVAYGVLLRLGGLIFAFLGRILLAEFLTFKRKKINQYEGQVGEQNKQEPANKNLNVVGNPTAQELECLGKG
jgi:multidrug transporter EmrE-like cation transporter